MSCWAGKPDAEFKCDRHVALTPNPPKRLNVALAFKPHAKGGIGHLHPDLSQGYLVERSPGAQRRFQGRAVLLPELDLGRFRTKAVIDWVAIRVDSVERDSAVNVNGQIKAAFCESLWVSGPDGRDQPFGTSFAVTLQDPTPERLYRLKDALKAKPKLEARIEIAAIEISVDWYPESRSERDRLLMTDLLWRHLLPPEELWRVDQGWPRSVVGGGAGTKAGKRNTLPLLANPKPGMRGERLHYAGVALEAEPEMLRDLNAGFHLQPATDGSVCFGRKLGDAQVRVMHKVMDQQDRRSGTRTDLEEDERRARIEVTLRGAELHRAGITTICDLPFVKFEELSRRYFTFWLPTIPYQLGCAKTSQNLLRTVQGRLEMEVFWRTGIFGLEAYQRADQWRRRSARRKLSYAGASRKPRETEGAFTELNERV